MTKNANESGCGPQPFGEQPSHATPLDRLTDLAAEAHAALMACEKSATPHYWRLGQILMLARKQVPRGDWADYLTTLGIEKTRASKARAIFRAFHTAEETSVLSVADAYDCRARSVSAKKPRRPMAEDAIGELESPAATLPHWIHRLAEDAARLRDEVQFLSPDECETLGTAIDRALSLLAELQAAVRRGSPSRPNADWSRVVADDNESPVRRHA